MSMKLLAVVTPLYIYHCCSTWMTLWEGKFPLGEFTALNMKNCGCWNVSKHGEIKGSDKYVTLDICLKFSVWTRWESHLQGQNIIWENQERGWLSLWLLRPKQVQRNWKGQGIPSEMSARRTLQILLGSLINYLIRVMRGGGPNMSSLTVTFTYQGSLWSVWWDLMSLTCTFTL